MTQEEKAKAYDEAREKIAIRFGSNVADEIFSQFEMSEDERIRKAIKLMYSFLPNKPKYIGDVSVEDMFAWLEKQGEQKQILDVEIPFGANDSELQEATYYIPKGFHAKIEGDKVVIKKGEQKPVDKIEPKFKVGDEIRTKNEESLIITRIDRCGYWSEDLFICNFDDADKWELVEQKPAWSEEDEINLDGILNCYKSMDIKWRNWLKSLKDKVQPKQEWSEEDEKMIQDIINDIAIAQEQVYCKSRCEDEINFLKSLKDRKIKKLKG